MLTINKNIVFTGLILLSSLGAYAQQSLAPAPFELTGTISGRDTGIVILQYADLQNKWMRDTTRVVDGKFTFKGELTGPTQAFLVGNVRSNSVDDPNFKRVFLEPGKMTTEVSEGDFQHGCVTGSKTQQEYDELNEAINPQRTALAAIRNTGSHSEQDAAAYDSIYKVEEQTQYRFAATHPNSFLSPFVMTNYRGHGISEDSAKRLYNSFSPAVRHSRLGLAIHNEMVARASTQPNHIAPSFVRRDLNGDLIRLSAYKGKSYVLLDFWASWCHPCRELSPHLKKMYAACHSKGLEIISISPDTDPDKWKRAIAQDSIGSWVHIGKYLNENANLYEIEGKYDVKAYPTLILIDKEGRVVGRYYGEEDLAIEDLDKKLQELFYARPSKSAMKTTKLQ